MADSVANKAAAAAEAEPTTHRQLLLSARKLAREKQIEHAKIHHAIIHVVHNEIDRIALPA